MIIENRWSTGGNAMVTRAMLLASRVKAIEAALERLERELENAEGSRKETLQQSMAEVQRTLNRLERRAVD